MKKIIIMEQIEKYKEVFLSQLYTKIGKLSDEEVNEVLEKVNTLIKKYDKSNLPQTAKKKILYQLRAIQIILNAELLNRESININDDLVCKSNEHIENNACISNIKSCNIENWIWEQTFSSNEWWKCIVKSCNTWYENIDWICLLIEEDAVSSEECWLLKIDIEKFQKIVEENEKTYNSYNNEYKKHYYKIIAKIRSDLYSKWVDASKIPESQIFALSWDLWKKLLSDKAYKELIRLKNEYYKVFEQNKKILDESNSFYNEECSK